MAKLDELLGKYLPEWPENCEFIAQGGSGTIYRDDKEAIGHIIEIADEIFGVRVTQSQYLAARDRIASEACTELPKPDRKLWKRAALAAFAGYCARPGMDAECAAEEAMFAADAFMNAMEKHLSSK